MFLKFSFKKNPNRLIKGRTGIRSVTDTRTLKPTWLQDMFLFIFYSSRQPSAVHLETALAQRSNRCSKTN